MLLLTSATALAAFPFTGQQGDPRDPTDLYIDPAPGEFPGDVGGETFKYAATPDPGNNPITINANPVELNGIRGASVADADHTVPTAWQLTTGRPDVTIAVMDSGIKWNERGAMKDLRRKTRLTRTELPIPWTAPGTPCATPAADPYDCDDSGAFDVVDYAQDPRVLTVLNSDPRRVGPPGMITPQDVIIAFSDGTDADGNGFVDDIAGWDFLDNDNDAFDDVLYGHGTGEAEGSTAEVANGDGEDDTTTGTCPNCRSIPMRVGDSFIADVNRFAQAVLYAADNDVQVVQSALGTLNNSSLAREAVTYAYRHGTTMVVSAADEAAQHNNQPYLPHTILVNSVTRSPLPPQSPQGQSYLAFNGCTNFNAKITLAIPSTSCSSDAVGLASGMAGLIYSAAYTAHELGALDPFPDRGLCELVQPNPVSDTTDCVISPNEVRQVLATGRINPPSDLAAGYQADDIDFVNAVPMVPDGNEPSCTPPIPGCTEPDGAPPGPGGAVQTMADASRTSLLGVSAVLRTYPARHGHDQFYGYGRVNTRRAVAALLDDPQNPGAPEIPPNVEITSPNWMEQVDPARDSMTVEGSVYARGKTFTCQVYVAPGHYPNNRLTTDTPPGDFAAVGSGACNGSATHTGPLTGALAEVDLAALKSRFPPETQATGFAGNERGGVPAQASNGRPANDPYGFVVKVVARADPAGAVPPMTGEDQRAAFLHRDADMLPGYPRGIRRAAVVPGAPTGDGESSPALADLDGDNDNELVLAGSDGWVHALRPDGSELPGWPVRGDQPPLHLGGTAFESGGVSSDIGGAFLASVAVVDANRDGIPEVFGADLEGKLYGWDAEGNRIFSERTNPNFSGAPLAPFENQRYIPSNPGDSETRRTQHGFIGSPVIANLDGQGQMEVIAAAMDRHVYAWHLDGTNVAGFPMLVVDPSKLDPAAPNGGVDPVSHQVTFAPGSGALMQGAIIDTPAVADLVDEAGGDDDGELEIIVGTNEEYDEAADGGFNAASGSLNLLDQARGGIEEFQQGCRDNGGPDGLCDSLEVPLQPANSRLFVLRSDGAAHDGAAGTAASDFAPGWPKKLGIVLSGLLPIVGEGVTGNPVVAEATCPSGGGGPKVAALANNGPAYIFNADGSSCYGSDSSTGRDITLATDGYGNNYDHPALPAVGHPVFGDIEGTGEPSLFVGAAGLTRALDLAFPEYQPTGQDFVAGWNVATGAAALRPNYPQPVNDLQFLTGPAIADIDGVPGEEVLEGTASHDLTALTPAGPPLPGWPKVTTDWTVATPTVGSWGTVDTGAGARKVVVALTRSGYLNAYATDAPACSPGSAPRFHHDNANSGNSSRDAISPGRPTELDSGAATVRFRAPGDDLLCGTAAAYEVATSPWPIDEADFAGARRLGNAPAPSEPGAAERYELPSSAARYVAVRAVDEQGNVGRIALFDRGPGAGPGPGGRRCGNLIRGGPRSQALRGTRRGDRILGFRGRDRIFGFRGADCLDGGAANDRALGHRGRDVLRGRRGADRLFAGPGRDIVRGGAARDRVRGGGGRDRLLGGAGADFVFARDRRRDIVKCGRGRDRVVADRRDRVRGCEIVRRRRG